MPDVTMIKNYDIYKDSLPVVVERSFDADRLNHILNHPLVRPDVGGVDLGNMDLSSAVFDKRNILLMGEHGCVMFLYVMDCMYEAHTQILPEGRGSWACELVKSCAEYMFTRTDALELLTRVPEGHIAAKVLAIKAGFKYEFTRHDFCKFRGKDVPVDIYSGRLQDWMPTAPNMIETGIQFHEKLHSEAERIGIGTPPHDDDENHNQYIGACIKMFMGGQLFKAMTFYNRWAAVSRHETVQVVSVNPPIIKFDIGLLKINGPNISDIEVIPCA